MRPSSSEEVSRPRSVRIDMDCDPACVKSEVEHLGSSMDVVLNFGNLFEVDIVTSLRHALLLGLHAVGYCGCKLYCFVDDEDEDLAAVYVDVIVLGDEFTLLCNSAHSYLGPVTSWVDVKELARTEPLLVYSSGYMSYLLVFKDFLARLMRPSVYVGERLRLDLV